MLLERVTQQTNAFKELSPDMLAEDYFRRLIGPDCLLLPSRKLMFMQSIVRLNNVETIDQAIGKHAKNTDAVVLIGGAQKRYRDSMNLSLYPENATHLAKYRIKPGSSRHLLRLPNIGDINDAYKGEATRPALSYTLHPLEKWIRAGTNLTVVYGSQFSDEQVEDVEGILEKMEIPATLEIQKQEGDESAGHADVFLQNPGILKSGRQNMYIVFGGDDTSASTVDTSLLTMGTARILGIPFGIVFPIATDLENPYAGVHLNRHGQVAGLSHTKTPGLGIVRYADDPVTKNPVGSNVGGWGFDTQRFASKLSILPGKYKELALDYVVMEMIRDDESDLVIPLPVAHAQEITSPIKYVSSIDGYMDNMKANIEEEKRQNEVYRMLGLLR